jgi:hypothetical protein
MGAYWLSDEDFGEVKEDADGPEGSNPDCRSGNAR